MNFLDTPDGGMIAAGIIASVAMTPNGVQGFNRHGSMVLWIPVEDYEKRVKTLGLVKTWVRDGKKAKQPDWTYLWPVEEPEDTELPAVVTPYEPV